MTQYYNYIWFDPIDNSPIYVGKGQKNRAYAHFKSKFKIGNVLRKRLEEGYNLVPKIYPAVDEQAAFAMEETLIAYIGRADLGRGTLLNLTDGGEGPAGYKHTEKALKAMKGPHSDEHKRKATDQCLKMAAANKGAKRSDEDRAKIKAAITPEVTAQRIATRAGFKHSEETRERMRQSQQAIKEKMSKALKESWAKRKAVATHK